MADGVQILVGPPGPPGPSSAEAQAAAAAAEASRVAAEAAAAAAAATEQEAEQERQDALAAVQQAALGPTDFQVDQAFRRAVMPTNLALDSDGIPYISPGASDAFLYLDTDGTPYFLT